MPSAVASAMPGEDEPAEYGECHENAKLDGAGLHYVCHMWYSSSVLPVSGCIENNISLVHLLLLQPSNKQRTQRLSASICTPQAPTSTGSNRCPVHCLLPLPAPASSPRSHTQLEALTTTATSLTTLLAISIHESPRHWTVASGSTVDFCSEHLRAALGRDHLSKWHTQAKDTIIRMVVEDTVEGISNSESYIVNYAVIYKC